MVNFMLATSHKIIINAGLQRLLFSSLEERWADITRIIRSKMNILRTQFTLQLFERLDSRNLPHNINPESRRMSLILSSGISLMEFGGIVL